MPLRSSTSSSWRFASSYYNPAAQATCHQLSEGAPCHAHYLAYWIRPHMQTFIPSLGDSIHGEDISPAYRDFSSLLVEVFGLPRVAVNSLGKVTCKACYVELCGVPTSPGESLAVNFPTPLLLVWLPMSYSHFSTASSLSNSLPQPLPCPLPSLSLQPGFRVGCPPLFHCLPKSRHHLVFPVRPHHLISRQPCPGLPPLVLCLTCWGVGLAHCYRYCSLRRAGLVDLRRPRAAIACLVRAWVDGATACGPVRSIFRLWCCSLCCVCFCMCVGLLIDSSITLTILDPICIMCF